MKRPIIESGEAKVIIYASKAGQNVTALDLIRACENREAFMRSELQKQGRQVVRTDRVGNPLGDIEITARWVVLGVKNTKRARRAKMAGNKASNASSAPSEQASGRVETPEGVQANQGNDLGDSDSG